MKVAYQSFQSLPEIFPGKCYMQQGPGEQSKVTQVAIVP